MGCYLPSKRIAMAVVTTFGEEGYDEKGNHRGERASAAIFAAVGAYLAPDDPPPPPLAR